MLTQKAVDDALGRVAVEDGGEGGFEGGGEGGEGRPGDGGEAVVRGGGEGDHKGVHVRVDMRRRPPYKPAPRE